MKRRRHHQLWHRFAFVNPVSMQTNGLRLEKSSTTLERRDSRAEQTPKPDARRQNPLARQPDDLSKQANKQPVQIRPLIQQAATRRANMGKVPVILLVLASCLLASCIHCLQSEMGSVLAPQALPAEPRAASDLSPARPQGNAFDQLVNLWASLANGQSQPQSAQQQPPQQQSPNVFLNSQNSNNYNMRRLQVPSQPQSQPAQVSTPVNPFLIPAFQPTRRQQSNVNPNQAQNGNNNNLLLVASSSPPTPHLTLNRLASLANQQQQQQSNRNQAQYNNFLLANAAANRPNNNNRPNIMLSNPQQQQQPRPQFSQPAQSQVQVQSRPPSQSPPFRAPGIQISGPSLEASSMKPISGFAPSGPPPSSGLNNAMVIVQSPPNAIGQQPPNEFSAPSSSSSPSPPSSGSSKFDSVPDEPQPTTSALPTTTKATAQNATEPNDRPAKQEDSTVGPSLIATTTLNESKIDSWNPVQAENATTELSASTEQMVEAKKRTSLAPSPDIVTVPPDYNPDLPTSNQSAPQSYDISVSAQMGSTQPLLKVASNKQQQQPATGELDLVASGSSASPAIQDQSIAPTAVTTIIWSPPATEPPSSSMSSPSSSIGANILPSRVSPLQQSSKTATPASVATPNRIRDNSLLNTSDQLAAEDQADSAGVVYGKAQARDSKPSAPNGLSPSPVSAASNRAASIESSVAGRPFIQPVQIDNQVRPYLASQQPALKSNSAPFKPSKPIGQSGDGSPMSVGSGFTIVANGNQTMPSGDIQDYVAGQPPLVVPQQPQVNGGAEPVISGQGGPDPAIADHRSSSTLAPPAAQQPRIRRPTFRPKLKDPVQIDSCLPGDASSCDQSHNEYCHREYGISSCHCRPGFARLSQLRGYCSPVSSFQVSFKIDKLSDDRQLVFNSSLQDSNNVEYQYLEFETLQALAGAIQHTSLAKQFMGAKVNKFFERRGKVWANVSLSLEQAQANRSSGANERLQFVANQELAKVSQMKHKPLGDSTIMLDGARESVSKLADIDECASRELNDCARNGSVCLNEVGGFQCQCLPGYHDPHLNELDRGKQGRFCVGCPPSYCSNRGECSIQPDGQKQCKCRANFMGTRCDIDSEVLAVAVGGSLVGVIILIITFWCLFVFNRRWKREQQKLDAMSATSGLTFNYVNSTMGPGGLHRSGGHQVGQMAAHYVGHRFGSTLKGGGGGGHYDQQAIIGSTSSGGSSSASSAAAAAAAAAALGCNPYAPLPMAAYQAATHYDDAGLLIGPASGGSSEQTSPSDNSYRAIMAGNSYTLSGHHHHHHHGHGHHHNHQQHHQQHQQQYQQQQHHHNHQRAAALTQFNPAAEYCGDGNATSRWRTMQPSGYYLSPDMLIGQQHQLYAAPQRELCIDTGQSRKQRGRRPS